MKRTCDKCVAAERDGECNLGYERKFVRFIYSMPYYIPAEPCPKPITIKKYIELMNKRDRSLCFKMEQQ